MITMKPMVAALMLVGCVTSLTSQVTASYNGPEHRQRPSAGLPSGVQFRLRSLWNKSPAVQPEHQVPHKRQIQPAGQHNQQQQQPLNIPALGFRRRQHGQRGNPSPSQSPFPFPHQFINQQQKQQQFNNFQRQRRPQQQQQQQQQQRRQFQPSPSPSPAAIWPRPTQQSVPTFSPRPQRQGQGPRQKQRQTQKRVDDSFGEGFSNFAADLPKHFSKLPGSFESNFGGGYHSPSFSEANDEEEPQADPDVDDGPSNDYEAPSVNNDDTPAGPAVPEDYDEPATNDNTPSHGFRFPPSSHQRPSPAYDEPSPSQSPYYSPTTTSNYEDEQSADYGTGLAEEGEGENGQANSNDEETESEGGDESDGAGYRPQQFNYRPRPTSSPAFDEPSTTSNDAADEDYGYNPRPQLGGFRRPQGGYRASPSPVLNSDSDDSDQPEPPRKYFNRPTPASYGSDDDDRPVYPQQQQEDEPDVDVDVNVDPDVDDGGRRPRPNFRGRGQGQGQGQGFRPLGALRPYYQQEPAEETRESEDDGPETSYRTSSEARDTNDGDSDGIPDSIKPEPFFQPKNNRQPIIRPKGMNNPNNLRETQTKVNDDTDEDSGNGFQFNRQRNPNNHFEDEEDDDDRRRMSNGPIYANDRGNYPKTALPQFTRFNQVQKQRQQQQRRPSFRRPQMLHMASRMDAPASSPTENQGTENNNIDRMDEQVDENEQKEPEQVQSRENVESETESPIKPKPFSSLMSISNTRVDIQAQRARLEALRQKFKSRASQRMAVQSREAPTEAGEETSPDIDVQKIMDAVGKDHKSYENIGGYIEDDPNSPRRIDKYESEAEFHSKLVDTKQTKDSRIRKLLRKRVQAPASQAEMTETTS